MIEEMERQEKVLLKVFMVGGSIMYFVLRWEMAQAVFKEYKYYLRWKYTTPSKENHDRLIEESEFKRSPFVNYFFLRTDGDMDGVIDFCAVAGITHDIIPPEEEKETKYTKAMIQLANDQSKMMKKFIKDVEDGDEWKKGKEGGETPGV